MSPERITTTTSTTTTYDDTDNQAYWRQHAPRFAAHVRQARDASTGPQTKPEHLTTNRHGQFIRVPLAGEVLWGFASDHYAEAFIADFGGELLPTGA